MSPAIIHSETPPPPRPSLAESSYHLWDRFRSLFVRADSAFIRIPVPMDGRLYVSPMPFGPYDRGSRLWKEYQRKGIQHVVCMVTEEEVKKKARRDILRLYREAGLTVHHIPILDYTAPMHGDIARVMPAILKALTTDRIVVHCNAGVGRTGVITGCIVSKIFDCSGEEAIDYIRQRTMLNLTTTQMYFTREFAKRFIIREEDSGKRYYGVDRRQGSQGKLVVTDSTPQPQKAN